MYDDWMSIIRGLSSRQADSDGSEVDWSGTLRYLADNSSVFSRQYMNQAMPFPVEREWDDEDDEDYVEPNTIDSWSTDMSLDDETDDNYLRRLGIK